MEDLTDRKIQRMSQFLTTDHFTLQGLRSGWPHIANPVPGNRGWGVCAYAGNRASLSDCGTHLAPRNAGARGRALSNAGGARSRG